MAYENIGYTEGAGKSVASDNVGGSSFQRVKLAVGAEGVAADLSNANPMPVSGPLTDVQMRATPVPVSGSVSVSGTVGVSVLDPSTATSFGPITTESTVLFAPIDTANRSSVVLQLTGAWRDGIVLQVSQDGTTYRNVLGITLNSEIVWVDTLYGPDVITIPVTARYFRAITSATFAGTVSGAYSLRANAVTPSFTTVSLQDVDPSITLPVGGRDTAGNAVRLGLNNWGHVIPADNQTRVGFAGQLGQTPYSVDTIGYNSISLQIIGTFVATVTFQTSNNGADWNPCVAWPVAGAAVPVTTTAAVGHWQIPVVGRFFRAQITAFTSGRVDAIGILRSQPPFLNISSPSIAANSSVNVAQIGATNIVTGGVAGIQAIGGNIAVGAAPTSNPVPLAWDGTNTRRILTDASSGGVVLGSSTVTNGQTLARGSQTVTTPAAISIKGSAGRLTMLTVANGGVVAGFLHLYNATAVTLGTTADVHVYAIPGAVANYPITLPDGGLYFSTGIQAAFTNGVAATDNTAFGAAPTLVANYAFI